MSKSIHSTVLRSTLKGVSLWQVFLPPVTANKTQEASLGAARATEKGRKV